MAFFKEDYFLLIDKRQKKSKIFIFFDLEKNIELITKRKYTSEINFKRC